MEVGLYIEEILKDSGKVSIPGVGTFYSNKIPARYDETSDVFLPPSSKINFKLIEEGNTSAFSEYISNAEGISVVAADRLINKFAARFITELGTTGSAEIEGLGKLKREGVDYIIETFPYYGLEPIEELQITLPPQADSASFLIQPPLPDFITETDDAVESDLTQGSASEEIYVESDISLDALPEQIEIPANVTEPSEEHKEEAFSEPIETSDTKEEEDYLSFRLRQREEERKKQLEAELAARLEQISHHEPLQTAPTEDKIESRTEAAEYNAEEKQEPTPEARYIRETYSDDEIEVNTLSESESNLFGDIIGNNEVEETSPRRFNSKRVWLLVAFFIFALAAGGAAYFFYPQLREFKKRLQGSEAQVAPKPAPVAVQPVAVQDSALADTSKLNNPVAVGDTSNVSEGRTFEISVHDFVVKSDAEALIKKLNSKGKNVYLVEMPNRKYKYVVSAGSFDSYAAAQIGQAKIKQDFSDQAGDINSVLIVPIQTQTK